MAGGEVAGGDVDGGRVVTGWVAAALVVGVPVTTEWVVGGAVTAVVGDAAVEASTASIQVPPESL